MALDFTRSVGYAAAQARQRAIEDQRQFQQNRALQEDAAGNQASNHNLTSALDDFEKRRTQAREEAYNQAAAGGQEAALEGKEAPKYTTDEMNRGASLGYSQGRMSSLQRMAKAQDEMQKIQAQGQNARDLAVQNNQLGTQRDYDRITAELAARNDPESQRLALERIRARNKGLKDAAAAGNPSLTTGAQTNNQEKILGGAVNLMHLKNARAALAQFSDSDFNLGGGIADTLRGAAQFIAPEKFAAMAPEQKAKLDQANNLRASISTYINGVLADESGKAVTDQEFRRKMAQLGIMFNNGSGMMFNNKAAMENALQLAEELSTTVQRYREQASQGNVKGTVDEALAGPQAVGTGAPVQGTSPDANVAPRGGVSPDGRTIDFSEEDQMLGPTGLEAPPQERGTPTGGSDLGISNMLDSRYAQDEAINAGPPGSAAPPPEEQQPQTPAPVSAAPQRRGAPTGQIVPTNPAGQPQPPAAPKAPPKAKAKPKAKPQATASRGEELAQQMTPAGGQLDPREFYKAAREEGLTDDEIHEALAKRGF